MQSLNEKKIGDNIIGNVRLGPEMNTLFLSLRGVVREIDGSGKPISMFGVLRDVTDEVRLTEERINAKLRESELRHLRASLNPHFLFNSLNTIKALAAEDSAKAQSAIVGLSDLLRTSLRITRAERIPLREELSVIRSYLELQKIRHEERLEWRIIEEPSCQQLPVPPMLFHQLVENAVKHGVERSQEQTSIIVRVTDRETHMVLSVENTGRMPGDYVDGIGLRSIREELRALYGENASFSLGSTRNGTVLAEIVLLKDPIA
jgi:LytS/YehU family sensor histidine kinase